MTTGSGALHLKVNSVSGQEVRSIQESMVASISIASWVLDGSAEIEGTL